MNPVRAGQTGVALGIVGFLFLFPFDEWYTILLGMLFLTAAVIFGCIAILTPSFLGEEPDEQELPPSE
jgi:hypothetical protein